MIKMLAFCLAAIAAGCAAIPGDYKPTSPCEISKASYECQIEQYRNVNVP